MGARERSVMGRAVGGGNKNKYNDMYIRRCQSETYFLCYLTREWKGLVRKVSTCCLSHQN